MRETRSICLDNLPKIYPDTKQYNTHGLWFTILIFAHNCWHSQPAITTTSLKVTTKIIRMTATRRNMIQRISLLCFWCFSAFSSSFTPSSTEVATCIIHIGMKTSVLLFIFYLMKMQWGTVKGYFTPLKKTSQHTWSTIDSVELVIHM